MKKHLSLAALLFFTAVLAAPVTAEEHTADSMWHIEKDLSEDHPCAEWGGVWRGWCMHVRPHQHYSVQERFYSSRRIRMIRRQESRVQRECAPVDDIVVRRACFRAQRRTLYREI